MRLAVAANGRAPTSEILALAGTCDSLPVSEMWITEDYYERGAFAVAGAVLAVTKRLSVGIGVVNPWTRHPVLTAMETAALAEMVVVIPAALVVEADPELFLVLRQAHFQRLAGDLRAVDPLAVGLEQQGECVVGLGRQGQVLRMDGQAL